MTDAPEHLLFVVRDGSHVFNVKFGDMSLSAVSADEATTLAEKIADAINDHTTQTADVVSEI